MVVGPLNHEKLGDQVAKAITSLISRGELKGGDPIPSELELARAFGVGRGTVRVAKQKLELLELIEVRSGKPTRVTANAHRLVASSPVLTLQPDSLSTLDVLDGRRHLESMLAELAVQRSTDDNVAEIKSALDEMFRQGEGDLRLHVEADKAFHLAVAKAAGNSLLYELYKACLQLADEMLYKVLSIPANRAQTNERHVPIYEAIRDRDPRRARRSVDVALRATEIAMQTHMLKSVDLSQER